MAISGTFTPGNESSMAKAEVDVDLGDTGTFAAIESWSTNVAASGGETADAETPLLDETVLVTLGRRAPITVVITCLFTKDANGPFKNIFDAYINNTNEKKCDVRWSEKGATTGDLRFFTENGKILNCTTPTFDANSAGLSTFQFTVKGTLDYETMA